jgi:hypothetical protein
VPREIEELKLALSSVLGGSAAVLKSSREQKSFYHEHGELPIETLPSSKPIHSFAMAFSCAARSRRRERVGCKRIAKFG